VFSYLFSILESKRDEKYVEPRLRVNREL